MKLTKIILILTLIISSSCGYKPIYLKNDQLFLEYNKIVLIGDERINKQIINIIGLKENKSNNSQKELTLKTNFDVKETSKNSKGQIETYRSIITNKSFLNEFSYNNKTNKFELTQYQNEIKNNLINKSSEEILLFLNLS